MLHFLRLYYFKENAFVAFYEEKYKAGIDSLPWPSDIIDVSPFWMAVYLVLTYH